MTGELKSPADVPLSCVNAVVRGGRVSVPVKICEIRSDNAGVTDCNLYIHVVSSGVVDKVSGDIFFGLRIVDEQLEVELRCGRFAVKLIGADIADAIQSLSVTTHRRNGAVKKK